MSKAHNIVSKKVKHQKIYKDYHIYISYIIYTTVKKNLITLHLRLLQRK